jgi:hypothetical protein
MRLNIAAMAGALSMLASLSPDTVRAQTWNDARSRALVEQATQRRAEQLADTALTGYRASARGFLTFLAQFGEGFTDPPQVVKADELALEVHWSAPNLSRQRLVGLRDTTLLPTDISYYRDRYGIVQNNFPSTIRMGDGNDVRDVPHPLSAAGLQEYDFAIRDSLGIRLPDRAVRVYEVQFRPRNERQPRAIGAVYIDPEGAQVVRMAFSFTRAAYIDQRNEDVSVVLENSLVHGRFWLPHRQEVEVRRTGTWLDYPARGIIRGSWTICCYEINPVFEPGFFRGPEIVQATPGELKAFPWEGSVLDQLPAEVRAVSAEDVARVQAQVQSLVGQRAVARGSGTTLAVRRISDFARFNRVEGLALGAGATVRAGPHLSLTAGARYGFSDARLKGRGSVSVRANGLPPLRVVAEHDFREAGEVRERSLLLNSIAAQEFGSDHTQPYGVTSFRLEADLGTAVGGRWRTTAGFERHAPLSVEASPATGTFAPAVPAWPMDVARLTLGVDRASVAGPWGSSLRLGAEARGGLFWARDEVLEGNGEGFARLVASARLERPVGGQRLILETTAAGVAGSRAVPPQELVFLGGTRSAPGFEFHQFAGEFGGGQRVELQLPVPFVSFPVGRYGRSPASATLAPYLHGAYIGGTAPFSQSGDGFYPSAGVGFEIFFNLIRFDVARGLRDGRWTFSVDVARTFWGIL